MKTDSSDNIIEFQYFFFFVYCYIQIKSVQFTSKNSFQTADTLNLSHNQKNK